jgi:hypothetical protein
MSEPDFIRVERDFAAHLRHPEQVTPPPDIEDRRVQVYRDLVYNNVAGFLDSGFPVLRSILPEQRWHALVRDFLAQHVSQSPYFVDIPAEFLDYLDREFQAADGDPPFLRELAHYEWMELVVDISSEEIPTEEVNTEGDLLDGIPVVSPLVHVLAYNWPVHHIAADYQPEQPLDQPVWLLIYRDAEDDVRFMEINAVTARLLALLDEDGMRSGRAVLEQIATELGAADPAPIIRFGHETLENLRARDIVPGTLQTTDQGEA